MLSNALVFGLPALSAFKFAALCDPDTYEHFGQLPKSPLSNQVEQVIKRVLINCPKEYEPSLQELYNELPPASNRSMDALINHQFKCVQSQDDNFPLSSSGVNIDGGKFYLIIRETSESEIENALPFCIAHEMSHLLNDDLLFGQALKTITGLATSVLTTLVLGWSLPSSLVTVTACNMITSVAYNHTIEFAADDFATQFCTVEELQAGVDFLSKLAARKENLSLPLQLACRMTHPSESERIERIEQAIKAKSTLRAA